MVAARARRFLALTGRLVYARLRLGLALTRLSFYLIGHQLPDRPPIERRDPLRPLGREVGHFTLVSGHPNRRRQVGVERRYLVNISVRDLVYT